MKEEPLYKRYSGIQSLSCYLYYLSITSILTELLHHFIRWNDVLYGKQSDGSIGMYSLQSDALIGAIPVPGEITCILQHEDMLIISSVDQAKTMIRSWNMSSHQWHYAFEGHTLPVSRIFIEVYIPSYLSINLYIFHLLILINFSSHLPYLLY